MLPDIMTACVYRLHAPMQTVVRPGSSQNAYFYLHDEQGLREACLISKALQGHSHSHTLQVQAPPPVDTRSRQEKRQGERAFRKDL